MDKIQVRLKDGTIRDVQGVPADYTVEVLDYDIDGYELAELGQDENHRVCRILEWPSEKAS